MTHSGCDDYLSGGRANRGAGHLDPTLRLCVVSVGRLVSRGIYYIMKIGEVKPIRDYFKPDIIVPYAGSTGGHLNDERP